MFEKRREKWGWLWHNYIYLVICVNNKSYAAFSTDRKTNLKNVFSAQIIECIIVKRIVHPDEKLKTVVQRPTNRSKEYWQEYYTCRRGKFSHIKVFLVGTHFIHVSIYNMYTNSFNQSHSFFPIRGINNYISFFIRAICPKTYDKGAQKCASGLY